MLLTYGSVRDPHVFDVACRVCELGLDTRIFDPGLTGCRISAAPDSSAFGVTAMDPDSGRFDRLERAPGALWWRNKYLFENALSEPGVIERYGYDTCVRAMAGQIDALGVPAFNSVDARARSRSKLYQLHTAVRAGLNTPPSIVSTDKNTIHAFAAAHGTVIMKALGPPIFAYVDEAGRARHRYVMTTEVAAADIDAAEESDFTACPSIFQARIDKQAEIRVIAFQDRVLAFRFQPDAEIGHVDWRMVSQQAPWSPTTLPEDQVQAIFRYLEAANLAYGVFDFAIDPTQTPWFLECNPDGQWMFIERSLDAGAISNWFARGVVDVVRGLSGDSLRAGTRLATMD